MSNKKECDFQSSVINEIYDRIPGVSVTKQDANYMQGIPDLLIIKDSKWAMLECKKSSKASHQPNQDFYVDKFNKMSFASFIYPENRKEVVNGLQKLFES